jgi:hypothetical protein
MTLKLRKFDAVFAPGIYTFRQHFGDPTIMMAIDTLPLSLAVILTDGLPLGSSKRCLSATIAARRVF